MIGAFLLWGLLLAAAPADPCATVVLEEVVAVVGGSPVLASDVALAAAVDLLPRAPEESDELYRARLLDRIIDLEVQFRDLEGTGALHRLQLDHAAVVAELSSARGDAEAVQRRLDEQGFGPTDLSRLATRVAAVRAHVEQQLRPRVRAGEAEVREAYDALVAQLAGTPTAAPPLEAVQERLERLVEERQLNREIEGWMAQARTRVPVSRPAAPETGGSPRTPTPTPARAPRSPASR